MDLFHLLHDIFKMIRRREKYDDYVDSHGGRKEGIGESYFDLSTPSSGEKEAKKPAGDEEKKKE